jgi:hypothetical protein
MLGFIDRGVVLDRSSVLCLKTRRVTVVLASSTARQ